jgi:hypothetical protein
MTAELLLFKASISSGQPDKGVPEPFDDPEASTSAQMSAIFDRKTFPHGHKFSSGSLPFSSFFLQGSGA